MVSSPIRDEARTKEWWPMGSLDARFIQRWVEATAGRLATERDFLTQLDAAIGDADHGINMDRGFTRASALAAVDETSPPGSLLWEVGSTVVREVGGAAGPLYGTGFRRMGEAVGTAQTFDAEVLLAAIRAGLEGVQALGAAVEGDKTMVDAWTPALAAFEHELRAGRGLAEGAEKAAGAAEAGALATVPLQARKGRASYLGSRSIGHQDPGATSTAILFRALADVAGKDP
jgi:phosphoenolpyruvate---glycerone phosphotransferase subunit DhaL